MVKNNIIDGKKISAKTLNDLKVLIDDHKQITNTAPNLAIILVGDDPASALYVQNKIKAAKKVGIQVVLKKFVPDITQQELLEQIEMVNQDNEIDGLIVQLPLPPHISKQKIISSIAPGKDVDGFHPINVGKLYSPHEHDFVPCTALGCLTLLKSCIDDLSGKDVVVIGRSNIVGRPLLALLIKEDCTVTICHSKTKDLAKKTKQADIVIAAAGKPSFLTSDYFHSNSIVIDVGINKIEKDGLQALIGDVDFDDVSKKVKYITPVPGGVGPMTVAYLLVNTYNAMRKRKK